MLIGECDAWNQDYGEIQSLVRTWIAQMDGQDYWKRAVRKLKGTMFLDIVHQRCELLDRWRGKKGRIKIEMAIILMVMVIIMVF